MRVLLCDDTPELRALLRSALESESGVEIIGEVGDGDAAMRLAADEQPDVVVLDLEMPGPTPEALLNGLRRAATECGARDLLRARAGLRGRRRASSEIALHVPKTTDLAAAARAVRELGSSRLSA